MSAIMRWSATWSGWLGFRFEIARAEIADIVRDALDVGATRVVVAGCIYELNPKARVVLTVLPKGGKARRSHHAVERHKGAGRLK